MLEKVLLIGLTMGFWTVGWAQECEDVGVRWTAKGPKVSLRFVGQTEGVVRLNFSFLSRERRFVSGVEIRGGEGAALKEADKIRQMTRLNGLNSSILSQGVYLGYIGSGPDYEFEFLISELEEVQSLTAEEAAQARHAVSCLDIEGASSG